MAMLAFAAGVATANWLTPTYGLVPVGFGMTATAAGYNCVQSSRCAILQL